jgi:hypothetical protein
MVHEEPQLQRIEMETKFELRSKLVDGLLTPLVLILLSVLLALLIRPIDIIFQRPGLLIYTIILLALAIFTLERCVVPRYSEAARACWGIVGGVFTWGVIEMSNFIGVQGLTSETGMISMVLVGLVVGVLWRKILPLGVKFFSVALLGGWVGHLGLYYTNLVVNMNSLENSTGTYPILGLMLGGLILIVLLWNFIQSKKRLSRLWGAVIVWMCAMLLIYIFRGIIV